MLSFMSELFDTSDFTPRWLCGHWTAEHGWLHICSDIGVWGAYVAIPCVLAFFALRRKDLPFRRIFLLFVLFILACGFTHLMEAVIFWWPAYRFAGLLKLCTAIVSWTTVMALIPITPKVLAMKSPDALEQAVGERTAALERANQELQAQILERQRAEAVLHEQREWFRVTLASIGDAVIATDPAGLVTYLNPAAATLTGWSQTAAVGQPLSAVFKVVHEETREPVENPVAQVVQEKKIANLVSGTLLVSREGRETPIEDSAAPILNEQQQMIGVVLVFHDITNRRQTEGVLRKGEEQLSLALHAGRMGTWDWDIPSQRVQWSPSLEAIHGLKPGTFPGTFEAYQSDMHPEDREGVLAKIRDTVENRTDYHQEYRLVWPDGTIHWIEARGKLFCDESGRPLHLMGVCIDINERKRAETNNRFLAEVSGKLAEVLDQEVALATIADLAVPVFADWCAIEMAEPDGSLRRLAVAHSDSERLVDAEKLFKLYPPQPDQESGAYRILQTGRSEMFAEITDEMLVKGSRDAEHLRLLRRLNLRSYIGVPLAQRGRTIGVITFATAESARHYSPRDLELAEELAYRATTAIENARLYNEVKEADRRKEEFLAMLAHELRNPLAPLTSALDLMKMGPDEETTQWAHGVMERQVQHMVRLVDDLLDVSRITRGKIELRKEPVQLASVVGRAVETARPAVDERGHELTVSLPPEPIWLEADPTRLAQVVGNLLNNAAKYCDGPGKIWISAERQGDDVVLRVRDTGLGIAPEVLPRIFDLFSQGNVSLDRSQGGLGIGLSLVRRLVEMHGGSVAAQSEGLGKGSLFLVRLPVLPAAPRAVATSEAVVPTTGRRVLVVDDNVGAATLIARLIHKCGDHQVEMAHDGLEALEAARRFRPDVIVLDIGLPKMDGFDVARRLRADTAFQNTLLVALTGYGQQEDRERSRDAGFDEHLVKPASLAALQKLFAHEKLK